MFRQIDIDQELCKNIIWINNCKEINLLNISSNISCSCNTGLLQVVKCFVKFSSEHKKMLSSEHTKKLSSEQRIHKKYIFEWANEQDTKWQKTQDKKGTCIPRDIQKIQKTHNEIH